MKMMLKRFLYNHKAIMEGVWHGDRVKARLEHSTNMGKGANNPIQQQESSKRIRRDGLQPPRPQ